ncbi:MnhB domain-containing protein [Halorussus salinus]|uniref:MnhB domain-containing protein n=1 Tax=Halorussus salinus TaxID=1364935 RepID=UPI0010929C82|nr:MnhB domain-containing protein [Halorussus salinus]
MSGDEGRASGDGESGSPDADADEEAVGAVAATTVRLVAPFAATFGVFTTLHGTSSVGGGFQGGVVVAATVVLLGFALGPGVVREEFAVARLPALAAAGVVGFAAVGVGPLAFGGRLLELAAYPIPKPAVYATEVIEVAIAATVAAALVGLFFALVGDSEARRASKTPSGETPRDGATRAAGTDRDPAEEGDDA